VARSASPAEAEEVADTMALTAEEEVRSALQYFATRVYSSQVGLLPPPIDFVLTVGPSSGQCAYGDG